MRTPDLVILVHHDEPGPQARALVTRAEESGAAAELWSPRDLAVEIDGAGARLLHRGDEVLPAVIVPQGINRSFAFCAEALRVAEDRGTVVVNPVAASAACVDKLATTRILAAAGVPVLATRAHPWGARGAGRPPWPGPLVTKPATGSNGEGVLGHPTADAARAHLGADRVLGPDGTVGTELLQPMADGAGEDLRVVVVEGAAIATTRRRAVAGFVTNGPNATAEASEDPGAARVAEAAAVALGLTYGAVDVIGHDGGPVVLEVNCWPRDLAYVGDLCEVDLVGAVLGAALAAGARRPSG